MWSARTAAGMSQTKGTSLVAEKGMPDSIAVVCV
jgi:hypothetical protein